MVMKLSRRFLKGEPGLWDFTQSHISTIGPNMVNALSLTVLTLSFIVASTEIKLAVLALFNGWEEGSEDVDGWRWR